MEVGLECGLAVVDWSGGVDFRLDVALGGDGVGGAGGGGRVEVGSFLGVGGVGLGHCGVMLGMEMERREGWRWGGGGIWRLGLV